MDKHFIEEVNDTVQKIRDLQEDGCFCFNVITDSHASPIFEETLQRQMHTFENIKEVNRRADIHAIFHLGDIPFVNYDQKSQEYWTTEHIEEVFDAVKENLCAANPNTYFVAGNHDSELAREPKRSVWHQRMVQPQKERIDGYVKNEPYYYVDFAAEKLRAVCMMSNYSDGKDEYYGIYREQVDWLASDALMAPDGWSILLFTHICPMKLFEDAHQDNLEEFAGFMTAFQKRECFASDVFTADFRNRSSARIVAMFVGHGHVDWVAAPGVLPFYVIETGSNHTHMADQDGWPTPAGCTVPRRQYGTVSEDLWDTVIYNYRKRTLDLIRFGAGEDRHIDL